MKPIGDKAAIPKERTPHREHPVLSDRVGCDAASNPSPGSTSPGRPPPPSPSRLPAGRASGNRARRASMPVHTTLPPLAQFVAPRDRYRAQYSQPPPSTAWHSSPRPRFATLCRSPSLRLSCTISLTTIAPRACKSDTPEPRRFAEEGTSDCERGLGHLGLEYRAYHSSTVRSIPGQRTLWVEIRRVHAPANAGLHNEHG